MCILLIGMLQEVGTIHTTTYVLVMPDLSQTTNNTPLCKIDRFLDWFIKEYWFLVATYGREGSKEIGSKKGILP